MGFTFLTKEDLRFLPREKCKAPWGEMWDPGEEFEAPREKCEAPKGEMWSPYAQQIFTFLFFPIICSVPPLLLTAVTGKGLS